MKSRGFTLVEMLACTALVALLAVVALTVSTSLAATRKDLAQAQGVSASDTGLSDTLWTAGLLDLLRWDLQQARQMQMNDTTLVLTGYGSLDPVTARPTRLPVRVAYRLLPLGQSPSDQPASLGSPSSKTGPASPATASPMGLVREQESLIPSLQKSTNPRQVVCTGIRTWRVQPPESPAPEKGRRAPTRRTSSLAAIPRQLTITIDWDHPGTPPLTQTLVLR